MRVLYLFADGFEDVEAIASRDVLVRAGIEVVDAKICDDREVVVSSHKMSLIGFKSLKNVDVLDFDALVIPGGSFGVKNLMNSSEAVEVVRQFYEEDKLICAICAGPMLIAKAGAIGNKRFTCYPGCNEFIYTGECTKAEVEIDGNLITGRSMLYSIPFGLAIIERLLGKEVKEKIYKQIAGLK